MGISLNLPSELESELSTEATELKLSKAETKSQIVTILVLSPDLNFETLALKQF